MENLPKIGENILRIRTANGLTLNVLSERSGVSKAMLSQIESEKVNPTLATIWKIAHGLGVELQDLLSDDTAPSRTFSVNPGATDTTHRLETCENGVLIRVLSPLNMVEDLEMYMLTFQPHSELPSEPHYPGTQEFITVIKGQVNIQAGEHEADLKRGDFIVYHSDIEHTISNRSDQPVVLHMVVRYLKK